ncbi:MAG: prepilin-type N-terminal cleavage/methylation domain-containing protein [Planctomycetota bacterium]|nr:prepilin-type N-terminal cleavage/methylation domain-containing protein [Planctomycetota bacterium]
MAIPTRRFLRPARRDGFTLIEVLIVIAIIALLLAIATPALRQAKRSAAQVEETAALRELTRAYLMHTEDRKGLLPLGYNTNLTARDDRGVEIASYVAGIYTWRLAPYFDYQFELLFDSQELEDLRASDRDAFLRGIAFAPRFGLNATFLGGDQREYGPDNADGTYAPGNPVPERLGTQWFARRLSDVERPSQQLVFASSYDPQTSFQQTFNLELTGNHRVRSPYLTARRWPESIPDASEPSSRIGFLAFRHNDKAVVSMIDGHAEAMGFESLEDMRRWSPTADRSDWVLELTR